VPPKRGLDSFSKGEDSKQTGEVNESPLGRMAADDPKWELREELDGLRVGLVGVGDEAQGEEAAKRAAERIRQYRTCTWEHLRMNQCHLNSNAAKSLADALRSVGSAGRLSHLMLSNNPSLGDAGAEAIADALREGGNTSLKVLALGRCGISDGGAGALGELLERSHSLRTLALDRNQITTEGAQILCVGLRNGPGRLTTLFLLGNRVDSDVLREIASLLPTAETAEQAATPMTKAAGRR
jgi:Leucine Rich repeat